MHLAFGGALLVCTLLAGWDVMRLRDADRVNQAIAAANVGETEMAIDEARFARALALSEAGEFRNAIQTYKPLIEGKRVELRRAALFNAGNVYLREALKDGEQAANQSLPLIELAKQSYRELLREEPGHWDARFNLERALWLAPESADQVVDEGGSQVWERSVLRANPGFQIELP